MKKPYLLTLLLCCLSFIAMAQQYPVQGFLRINAPYPAFLSDYASPYSNKLNLSLTLTDLTLPDCRVRLRFTIARQNGVVARNADFLQSGESVIILSGGIPHTLTSTELAPYFRPENLQGLSPDAYSSQLPEGMYTFSVEVFDYFTGRKLSASIGQMLWIMLSEPPLLEEPANKARLADFMEPASTGNIIFRWTSRSAIAAYTEYTFTLCEIWDEQGDPYRQFLASIPKYQTTTPATTLLYGPADPPLLPGKLYAWRVQAKAKEGLETVGLYRQNGESEIRLFRYGSNCPKMTDYRVEVKSDTRIYLSWTAPLNALPGTGYKVAWHKTDPPGKWPWHEAPATTDNYYYLNDLKPGSDYELKVGVVCPEGQQSGAEPEVIYSNIQRTTTLPQGKIAGVECGRTPPPVDLSNQTLIEELKVGDAVMAADCEHVITKLSGDKNGWSGECYVEEPMLGGIRLKMTFKNIRVNTDKRMIAGAFYSVYNPNAPSIINAGKTIDEAKTLVENAVGSATSVVNSATDLTKGGTATGAAVTGNSAANYQTDFVITEVEASKFTPNTNNGSGGTLNFGGGKTLKVDTVPTTIKDAGGNLFAVDKTGKISQVGAVAGANLLANADFSSLDMDKGRVEFAPAEGMKYAFDPWQKAYAANSDWDKRYEKLTSSDTGEYRVAAKAIVPGATDKVKAIITLYDKNLSPDSIRFVTRKGVVLTCDKNKVITLVGGPADDAQEVFAIYPQSGGKPLVLGKLLVASYNSMTIDVDLVPVNDANANAQAIADALNKVYQPIGISFRVNLKPEFNYDALTDKGLMVEGSGLLSAYTDQMKALNSAYASTTHYSPDHLVLFALKQGAGKDGNTTILGDMPRAQQFGYIFTKGQSGKEQGLVAAHEVGHGLFQLRHTFDYSGIKQGALPDNLMDYSAGNQLSKLQWDLIHDPGLVFGLFETDKGGQMKSNMVLDEKMKAGGILEIINYIINNKYDDFKSLFLKYYKYSGNNLNKFSYESLLLDLFDNKIQVDLKDEAKIITNIVMDYMIKKEIQLQNDIFISLIENEDEIPTANKLSEQLLKYLKDFVRNEHVVSEIEKYLASILNFKVEKFNNSILSIKKNAVYSIKSNQRFKLLLRTVFNIENDKRISQIMELRRTNQDIPEIENYFKSNKKIAPSILKTMGENSNMAKLLEKETQDLNQLLRKTLIKNKLFCVIKKGFTIIEFASFFDNSKEGSVSPATIISFIPTYGLLSYYFETSIDNINTEMEEVWIESLSEWSSVVKWNKIASNRKDLVLQYTEEKNKFNKTIPTSIRILDKELAKQIFGFYPKYVNYDYLRNKNQYIPRYFVPYIK
jgi:hypothetical protein